MGFFDLKYKEDAFIFMLFVIFVFCYVWEDSKTL